MVKLIVQVDQCGQALRQMGERLYAGRRHEQRELVTADARRADVVGHRLLQHLAGALQQRVAGGVAERVVGFFQTVQVGDQHADRERALALQAHDLVVVERAVAQLGQRVVFAQVFEVGLGLLARGDVGQRHQHHVPTLLVRGQHRKLQVDIDLLAGE